ncbi:beta-fructofuranosidase, soluble isoenzyme I isoform X1 [Lactuca sativa]|uniref:beta-fructofuranosidase, soluble isoenzyme I isoform X1 n=1 Tax=Lactuca sativa TaxID=4236 RepID=UPI000CD9E0DA|nr:beta-fructofuranosidase, soluble isoenzyme I isoform X1 [Lactuca sativa]
MMASPSDLENPIATSALPYSYAPLPDGEQPAGNDRTIRPSRKTALFLVSVLLAVAFLVTLFAGNSPMLPKNLNTSPVPASTAATPEKVTPSSRGVDKGVSEKAFRPLLGADNSYPWSNNMLDWQRTAFHFQPKKNWMNDPNGPVFYNGWYHLFYQYHPDAPVWGKIVWGHAVSKDLINWRHLPIAMETDQWYDEQGVWTGSATILSDGQLVVLYTGSTNESVQVQNLAYPADPSDPLLINWVKYPGNPVLVPPPGIDNKDFRDPTTAWKTPEGKWRITIGSKINKTGISLVYDTEDFRTFELLDGLLHAVPGTGMWECVDFYPISKQGENGLDTSVDGPGVKHIVKASMDDDRNDYYAIGTYDAYKGKWTPDNPTLDVGIGLRYDYGIYYASKTFFDQNKQRRVLWSWIKETDTEASDIKKGWASVMGVPRTIVLDKKTQSNIIQWPVEEINRLRTNLTVFKDVVVEAGSLVPLNLPSASQLDIVAEFEVDKKTVERLNEVDAAYNCAKNGGAAQRGALGPFGFSVLAHEGLAEHTPVYFYVAKGVDGNLKTFFCADQSRSSNANDVDKSIYGSIVPVLKGEKLSMRILVDHSIVESFAQEGRSCITSRVYPTKAINSNAQLFLFNNATASKVTVSVNVWQMDSAHV